MTTRMPSLDASSACLAELRGDPRYTDDDCPAPAYIERLRDLTAALIHPTSQQDDDA